MPKTMSRKPNRDMIAARMTDIDTVTGQMDGLEAGFILCERTPERQAMRPHSSKFVVRPWEPDMIRLLMRGFDPLVSGDGGENLDGRPLFIAAAEKYPERAEEFLACVAKIDQSRQNVLINSRKSPPTIADREARQTQIIADGMAQGLASRETLKAELRAELEAEIAAEADPVKRGPGRPRKDATTE